jgi:hypothetical protein
MRKMYLMHIAVAADILASDKSVYPLCILQIWRQITTAKAQTIQGQQQVCNMEFIDID